MLRGLVLPTAPVRPGAFVLTVVLTAAAERGIDRGLAWWARDRSLEFYLHFVLVAPPAAVFAWILVSQLVRLLQTLGWSAVAVVPVIPASQWPCWTFFDFGFSSIPGLALIAATACSVGLTTC